MSDTLEKIEVPTVAPRRRGRHLRSVAIVVVGILLILAPLSLSSFWLQIGLAIAGAGLGAIGLNLLVGSTGQLSFAHPVFVAVGAVGYAWLAGSAEDGAGLGGLGLPPLLAAILAVVAAGVVGIVISPLASRLKGIYLGVATIALIFVAQHVLDNWRSASGGYNGRISPELSIFGFSFADGMSELTIAGVPFGRDEKLWYVGLVVLFAGIVVARNMLDSRLGRSMAAVRDSEVLAAMNGIDVRRCKRHVFAISAIYAGTAGVIYALAVGSVTPEAFDLPMSINYLAMIVIGGLGSVWGSVLGAALVTALPLLLQQHAASLPIITATGESGGVDAAAAARYIFALTIIVVLLLQPRGLAGLVQDLGLRIRRFSSR
ncbi:branched-chain amino acid ABC transporter permease [Aeromicrobium choanae]|uniref:Amino acid/amide ABC transporter membrane protein 2, HAAT family n=1 Tax=Aeromicrobium choanae TaxID=1736691 RepID=A0A1T4YTC9_9ACTN|nr:branched-chain amino acid ABC transporter permease [Aeromicrobium choanae]SKB04505.1 amino acid/amide ABC transporter membrane protein 2, HAAT family [Aeromicrobium choanae]